MKLKSSFHNGLEAVVVDGLDMSVGVITSHAEYSHAYVSVGDATRAHARFGQLPWRMAVSGKVVLMLNMGPLRSEPTSACPSD